MGRFISPDTIVPNPANPQALNRFSYCLNNPLKYVDPSGHKVEINGTNTKYIDNWDANDFFWLSPEEAQLISAWLILEGAAPELTSYLEAADEVISIEWNSTLTPLEGAKWHAGLVGNSWIYINESQKGGNVNILASTIGHEGFHGAIWIGAGHYRENFAANEAFAYSFGYQVDQKLGITSGYLSTQMSDINPSFSGDLNARLTKAATTLIGLILIVTEGRIFGTIL